MINILIYGYRSFKTQQLSVCVRYTKGLEVQERFLGFLEVSEGHDAIYLASSILEFLEKLNFRNVCMVGQSHDGASVMSGHLGGVQFIIKEKHAIYTHCIAHRLN